MDGRISNLSQVAYARRYTLDGGKEKGLKVIEINNGVLRFILNESKALDIMQLWHYGVNISFVSKNGFTARETPFLNRFEGGMLYTCGLDSAGGRDGFEIHGSLHNIPAEVTKCEIENGQITVQAIIRDTALFGKNLLLKRTITTAIGSDSLTLCDRLVNCGTKAEDYCLLYHCNLGYPMLDKGVVISSDAKEIIPRTTYAKERLSDRTVFTAPVDNQEERCYFLKNKTPTVSAENPTLKKRFTLSYSGDTLPCMVQWNSAASGDYALGLEPTTTFLDDYFKYNSLAPDNSVDFTLKISVENI